MPRLGGKEDFVVVEHAHVHGVRAPCDNGLHGGRELGGTEEDLHMHLGQHAEHLHLDHLRVDRHGHEGVTRPQSAEHARDEA